MPWGKDFQNIEVYRLNQTMVRMKARHKALSHGGMKFLYAEGNVVSIARFWAEEVFVGVISTEDRDVKIRLPVGAVGASCPGEAVDIFGKKLEYEKVDDNHVALIVRAHQSYFMECQMK